ncbi:DUF523 domain-containing protein [Thermoproteota archaeon]
MTRIVISRCLGLDACRYDGKKIDVPWLRELSSKVMLVSVCPEVEIGLGVPRKPINLIKDENGVRIIQDETGIDISEDMVSSIQGYLCFIGNVDAFVLKSKSPSCGLGTTKIQQEHSYSLGSGVFAVLAEKKFPRAVFVDECFMNDKGISALLALINHS